MNIFVVLGLKHMLCYDSNQVCHIVLGLRPATPKEEGQIIRLVNAKGNLLIVSFAEPLSCLTSLLTSFLGDNYILYYSF